MTTKTASSVVRLSKARIEALIDREARRRLSISGQEFRRRLKENSLPREKLAVRDIADLVKLVGEDNSGNSRSSLR